MHTRRRAYGIVATALAIVVVVAALAFGAYGLTRSPTVETSYTTSTITSTYTTTVTPGQEGNLVNCVVYYYQVLLVANESNGSHATASTGSGLVTDYTTTTSVSQQPGYATSTSTSVINSDGPAWNSTVCTWLP